MLQIAGVADGLGDDDKLIERAGDGTAQAGYTQQCDEPGDDQDNGGDGRIAPVAPGNLGQVRLDADRSERISAQRHGQVLHHLVALIVGAALTQRQRFCAG